MQAPLQIGGFAIDMQVVLHGRLTCSVNNNHNQQAHIPDSVFAGVVTRGISAGLTSAE